MRTRYIILLCLSVFLLIGAALFFYNPWQTNSTGGDAAGVMRSSSTFLPERELGAQEAPLVMVEYASFTCSHCATFHEENFSFIKENYIDTGKLRYIFRPYPLDQVAFAATLLSYCIPKKQFFPFISGLFKSQRQWALGEDPYSELLAIARQTGMQQDAFDACLSDPQANKNLQAFIDYTQKNFKIRSTPTFFLNGEKRIGALTPEQVTQWLSKTDTSKKTPSDGQ